MAEYETLDPYGNYGSDSELSPYELLARMKSWNNAIYITLENQEKELLSQISLVNDTITARVTDFENEINTQISVMNGEIDLRVEKDGIISAINQTAETIKIQAAKIDLTGYATFTALATKGATVIHGGNLMTGTVTADYIVAGAIDGMVIRGVYIRGGYIESDTVIDVETDVIVGNNIYMTGATSYGNRNIYFTTSTGSNYIRYTGSSSRLDISTSIFEVFGDAYFSYANFSNNVNFTDDVSFSGRVYFENASVYGLDAETVGGFSFGFSSATKRLYVSEDGNSLGFVPLQ